MYIAGMKGSWFNLTCLWVRSPLIPLFCLLRRPPAEDSRYNQAGGKNGDEGVDVGGGYG